MSRRIMGAALALCLLGAIAAAPPTPIADAARQGDVQAVRTLLAQGADVNASAGDGMTALHWAAERGDVEMTRVLLSARADVARGTRIGGYTPLHVASRGGHTAVARLLLEAGADPRVATTNSGATPLHLAAASAGGGAELVRLLVERGADVNAVETSSAQTPLMFAAVAGRADAIRELMARKADPSATTYVIDVLGAMARDQAADRMLREGIAALRPRGDQDWKPTPAQIQELIQRQREQAPKEYYVVQNRYDFLNTQTRQVNSQDLRVLQERLPATAIQTGKTGGMTALTLAAREGHVEAVRALLDGGADIDQVSAGTLSSALLTASLNGQFDVAMLLVERGANPNLKNRPEGATPLFAVIQAQWPGTPNYPQPRAFLRQKATHHQVLEALLKAGANPNVPLDLHPFYWEQGRIGLDIRGATPFWRAAFARDLEAMKMLVAYGADPHKASVVAEEAMMQSRQRDGRQEESSGLRPLPEGAPDMAPIHVAAGGGYLGIGASIVEGVPDGFMAAVKYLVEEHGADVNLPDAWGYYPIHYAATRGDNALVQYLVEKGADVNAITRLGMSPLDMTLGGQRGFFGQAPRPETATLLRSLGSVELCKDLHFDGTGTVCPTAGTSKVEEMYGYPTTPLYLRPFSERWGWTGWEGTGNTGPNLQPVSPAAPPVL
jgi:ankyrin repeat protein